MYPAFSPSSTLSCIWLCTLWPHSPPKNTPPSSNLCLCQSLLDQFPSTSITIFFPTIYIWSNRHQLVGRCKFILWHWSCSQPVLGYMEMGLGHMCWTQAGLQHWLSRGHNSGAWLPHSNSQKLAVSKQFEPLLSLLRQFQGSFCPKQRPLSQLWNQQNSKTHLLTPSPIPCVSQSHSHPNPWKYLRCTVPRRCRQLPPWFPINNLLHPHGSSSPPLQQTNICVASAFIPTTPVISEHLSTSMRGFLELKPSPLWPNCWADE